MYHPFDAPHSSFDGARWISSRPNFFLSVKVLSRLFRRLFLRYLQEAFDAGKLQFFSLLQALQDPDPEAITRYLDPVRNVEWSSTPSHPSPGHTKWWTKSTATRTG